MRLIATLYLFCALCLPAQAANKTELTWFGHAAFRLTTPTGKILYIDPWIMNPANKNGKEDLAKIEKADLILITHGHNDHVGNSVEIAKKTGAKLVTTFDLGKNLVTYGGFPKEQMGFDTQGNFGGALSLLDDEVRVTFIPAIHSSSVTGDDGKNMHGGGNPGGFVIAVKNGPTLYHTGDTDVFSDMALISRFQKIDLMLACIGGHFTMGPARAAEAVKLVKPKTVIPMHFGTYPVLSGTPEAFQTELRKLRVNSRMQTMSVGQTLTF